MIRFFGKIRLYLLSDNKFSTYLPYAIGEIGLVVVGILIALVLYINEFPDYKADKEVGKNTLVVLLGKKISKNIYILFLITAYILVIAGAFYELIPYYTLLVLLTLPIALKAISTLTKNYGKIDELLPANKATIGIHFLFGLTLALGYVLDKVF